MTKDGRPRAFPSNAIDPYFGGMELRDYYAGQALAGFLANPDVTTNSAYLATTCYEFADAMMAEREESAPGV